MTDTTIQLFKQGKLTIDITMLSNEDKVKLLQMENLLKDLIKYYELSKFLKVGFNEGHYTDLKEALK